MVQHEPDTTPRLATCIAVWPSRSFGPWWLTAFTYFLKCNHGVCRRTTTYLQVTRRVPRLSPYTLHTAAHCAIFMSICIWERLKAANHPLHTTHPPCWVLDLFSTSLCSSSMQWQSWMKSGSLREVGIIEVNGHRCTLNSFSSRLDITNTINTTKCLPSALRSIFWHGWTSTGHRSEGKACKSHRRCKDTDERYVTPLFSWDYCELSFSVPLIFINVGVILYELVLGG